MFSIAHRLYRWFLYNLQNIMTCNQALNFGYIGHINFVISMTSQADFLFTIDHQNRFRLSAFFSQHVFVILKSCLLITILFPIINCGYNTISQFFKRKISNSPPRGISFGRNVTKSSNPRKMYVTEQHQSNVEDNYMTVQM